MNGGLEGKTKEYSRSLGRDAFGDGGRKRGVKTKKDLLFKNLVGWI